MNDRKSLGSNIKKYRQFRGLEREDLANKTGLNPKTIERLELGKENISLDNLIKICKMLDVSMEELFIKNSNLLSVRFVISEHNVKTFKEFISIIKDIIENR